MPGDGGMGLTVGERDGRGVLVIVLEEGVIAREEGGFEGEVSIDCLELDSFDFVIASTRCYDPWRGGETTITTAWRGA
jgi:hypothetical protein